MTPMQTFSMSVSIYRRLAFGLAADVVAAEDTRRTRALAARLGAHDRHLQLVLEDLEQRGLVERVFANPVAERGGQQVDRERERAVHLRGPVARRALAERLRGIVHRNDLTRWTSTFLDELKGLEVRAGSLGAG